MEVIAQSNLVSYRLDNNTAWIDRYAEKLSFDALYEYQEKVYSALKKLGKGRHYDIERDVPADMQELFIKLSCMYFRHDGELYFEDDFTKIYRNKL